MHREHQHPLANHPHHTSSQRVAEDLVLRVLADTRESSQVVAQAALPLRSAEPADKNAVEAAVRQQGCRGCWVATTCDIGTGEAAALAFYYWHCNKTSTQQ